MQVRDVNLSLYLKLDLMLYYALKVIISAIVIVAIAEIAKRNTGLAALVASLPLTSLLVAPAKFT